MITLPRAAFSFLMTLPPPPTHPSKVSRLNRFFLALAQYHGMHGSVSFFRNLHQAHRAHYHRKHSSQSLTSNKFMLPHSKLKMIGRTCYWSWGSAVPPLRELVPGVMTLLTTAIMRGYQNGWKVERETGEIWWKLCPVPLWVAVTSQQWLREITLGHL